MLALLAAGCATTGEPPAGQPLLAFLADGATPRREVLARLGEPSARFEGGRILTYRLGPAAGGALQVVPREATPTGWPDWIKARHSLVLVFDTGGVLREHSLVEVR